MYCSPWCPELMLFQNGPEERTLLGGSRIRGVALVVRVFVSGSRQAGGLKPSSCSHRMERLGCDWACCGEPDWA